MPSLERLAHLKLPRLKAELVVMKNCPCRPCRERVPWVEQRIQDLEAAQPPPPPVDDGYETVAGVRMPKAKRSYPLTPAQRVARAKRFERLRRFSNTVEGVTREQDSLDRTRWARGHTVRG